MSRDALYWKLVVPIGLASVLTMPLTAIWFLFIGFATFAGTAFYAAAADLPDRASFRLRTGGSVGIGLLAGPLIYLGLAVLT